MKKVLIVCLSLFTFLGGCSNGARVETMNGWSFQYNEGTDDYSLFFGLCDSNENYLATDAEVDIRIVNDNDEVVYEDTKEITKKDFGTYTNQIAGERYLADVRIDSKDIKEGTSSNGTVYFVVDSDYFSFDEANCKALGCLPTAAVEVDIVDLPIELSQKDPWGSVESKVKINDVEYKYDDEYGYPSLTFTISGEKTYSKRSSMSYDIISYKLYDDEGYLVDSG